MCPPSVARPAGLSQQQEQGLAARGASEDPRAPTVLGMVADPSGAPVAGARVIVEMDGRPAADTTTRANGGFSVTLVPPGEVMIRVSAAGFAGTTQRISLPATGIRIVLQPAPFVESVTVTASRGAVRLATPSSTSVLTSADLFTLAAGTLDDALRNTPGFSLFRRSSSRVANPTTQGVTLRGVSGSGASRTLVLADGWPLNDPFGSWVYWNRIPYAAIDRVEVVRGAVGDLYGADALGGVIQVLTFEPGRARLRATIDASSHDTVRASAFGGASAGGWSFTAAGERLETDGVVVVSRAERGTADVPAQSDYHTGFAAIAYDRASWRAQARASGFGEARNNGTPLQVNDTEWRQFSGELAGHGRGGAWLIRGSNARQTYAQTFSAIAADRQTERLTTAQRIPTSFAGLAAQWVGTWGAHAFIAGAEGRRTKSTVAETRYSFAGVPSGPFYLGGRELNASVFGRLRLAPRDDMTVVIGARGDRWDSDPEGPTPEHSVGFFSPRASFAWRAGPVVSLQVTASRTYRTPTLNELYRGFRVGNIVTNANPLLDPERLTGIDGGVLFAGRRASARVTAFWNMLDDAIANITLDATPTLITRERQNADQIRAAGLEVETDLRPHPRVTVTLSGAFTTSRFRDTPKQPAIEGNRVPQVPRYQVGVGVTGLVPRTATIAAQVRVVGSQYDDDLNALSLGRYTVVDASATRALGRSLHAFVAVENLFAVEYDVGRTPVRTVGWPRTVLGGLRLFLP